MSPVSQYFVVEQQWVLASILYVHSLMLYKDLHGTINSYSKSRKNLETDGTNEGQSL